MKFLDKPCPRCGEYKLRQPEKRGTTNRKTCLCFACSKRAGYKVIDHLDGTQSYDVYAIGGIHPETKLRGFRLQKRHWDTNAQEVTLALDAWRNRDILCIS